MLQIQSGDESGGSIFAHRSNGAEGTPTHNRDTFVIGIARTAEVPVTSTGGFCVLWGTVGGVDALFV